MEKTTDSLQNTDFCLRNSQKSKPTLNNKHGKSSLLFQILSDPLTGLVLNYISLEICKLATAIEMLFSLNFKKTKQFNNYLYQHIHSNHSSFYDFCTCETATIFRINVPS